jgi:hypothetical protein
MASLSSCMYPQLIFWWAMTYNLLWQPKMHRRDTYHFWEAFGKQNVIPVLTCYCWVRQGRLCCMDLSTRSERLQFEGQGENFETNANLVRARNKLLCYVNDILLLFPIIPFPFFYSSWIWFYVRWCGNPISFFYIDTWLSNHDTWVLIHNPKRCFIGLPGVPPQVDLIHSEQEKVVWEWGCFLLFIAWMELQAENFRQNSILNDV